MSVSSSIAIRDLASSYLARIEQRYNGMTRAARAANDAVQDVDVSDEYRRADTFIGRTIQRMRQFVDTQGEAERGARGVKSAWSGVPGIIRTAMGYLSLRAVTSLSDSVTSTTARLNLMNDGLQTTAQLQEQIMASANRARASYLETAQVVSKLGILAGKAFGSNTELIAFAELMNKNFVVGGAGAMEQASAMHQLTQAMASGRLQGDEYRSIIENAPLLARAIEDYMVNVRQAEGSMKDWASAGLLTADVIKEALFSSADEVEARFRQMPMTFSQVATLAGNALLKVFDPVIQTIGRGAQWIYDNWEGIAPVVYGVGAALLFYGGAAGLAAAQQAILNSALMASPLGWIAAGIAVVVGLAAMWIRANGGLRASWLTLTDAIQTGGENAVLFFYEMTHAGMTLSEHLILAFATAGVSVLNTLSRMKITGLQLVGGLVDGALTLLDKLPGVDLSGAIGGVGSWVDARVAETESKIDARYNELGGMERTFAANQNQRQADLTGRRRWYEERQTVRDRAIESARNDPAADSYLSSQDLMANNLNYIDEIGSIRDDVKISEDSLKLLRDVGMVRVIERGITMTPTFINNIENVNENADIDRITAQQISRLQEELAVSAAGVHA